MKRRFRLGDVVLQKDTDGNERIGIVIKYEDPDYLIIQSCLDIGYVYQCQEKELTKVAGREEVIEWARNMI
jgi:hypothetical protein